MRIKILFKRLIVAVAVTFSFCVMSAQKESDVNISWLERFDLGRGAYARVHRLSDGRFMAAYSRDDAIVARFASIEDLGNWSKPTVVARSFSATNSYGSIKVNLANAEFAQLKTGRIIYACNLRPQGWRHDIHPCGIAVSLSDDAGKTWSPLKVVYSPSIKSPADGHPRGCYEPFVLPLDDGKVQIYFADETPYDDAKCAWQNISFVESSDFGESWGSVKMACYTPKRRDGMPVVTEFGKWRYLAIEANPGSTFLHPQIVRTLISDNWNGGVLPPSPSRSEPIISHPDWNDTVGGAPYIAMTKNFILLSWQEGAKGKNNLHHLTARVAAMPKDEITSDGEITAMRGNSTPVQALGKPMLWNSLCHLVNDDFLLVTQERGHIVLYRARVGVSPARAGGNALH